MHLQIGDALKNPGQSYPFSGSVSIEEMEILGDSVTFSDVTVQGEFTGTGDGVAVEASVQATVHAHCATCLDPVERKVKADMDVSYMREPDPNDPDLYAFTGHSVEIDDAVREALLLELPIRFQCGKNCKGLCPVCGKNLNHGDCDCAKETEVSGPFAALKDFRIQNEEV